MIVTFEVPVRTYSLNEQGRTWRARYGRTKKVRGAVAPFARAALRRVGVADAPAGSIAVTMTRIAPSELDSHDNLRGALKPVADQVTEELGLRDDRDARLTWNYAQEVSGFETYRLGGKTRRRGIYGVRVRIDIADQEAA